MAATASHPPAKPLNELFASAPVTIFETMSKLAALHNSVNLGQGFPDEEGPHSMKEIAGKALIEYHNQYPSLLGVPELREAVARHSESQQGIPCNAATDTLITVGATEGIAACMLGLINPGDEVIMFDPMYDSYPAMAKRAGAVIRPVRLRLPDFSVPPEELTAAFNSKTKLIIVNTPHNPSGKVFTLEELQLIARLCQQHDVIAMCDEVYEHLVFNGSKHISLRALPGMADRCVRLGSAGKTFSFTAWKVGWITGPPPLLAPIIKAHQFMVFTVPSNLQRAVAYGLDKESSFYLGLGTELARKRALLEGALTSLGVKVLPGHGAYFLVADIAEYLREGEDDQEFCKRLTAEAGVTLIPISGFYIGENPPKHLVRFAYCKEDEKLHAAVKRLRAYLHPTDANGNGKAQE